MALQRRSADREEKHWLKATLNPDGLISELPPGLPPARGLRAEEGLHLQRRERHSNVGTYI